MIGKINFSEDWNLQTRILLDRRQGKKFDQLQLPLLHLEWAPEDQNLSLKIGRFINPFGSFNFRQLAQQRTFIGLPLAYQYYVNISDKIGLAS